MTPKRGGRRAGARKGHAMAGVRSGSSRTTVPPVVMTEEHARVSLLKVGDTMPDFRLPNAEGKEQSLGDLQGKRLTVVCLWDHSLPYAVEELHDLGPQVAKPYKARGLEVVAVHEHGGPETASKAIRNASLQFPLLYDESGELMAKVAKAKLPRTYLVNDKREIVWLDLEYSRTTRRDLQTAITVELRRPAASKPAKQP